MTNGAVLVVGSIYVPDFYGDFYGEVSDFEPVEQVLGDEVVGCSRIDKDFSFSRRVCRFK